MWTLTRTGKIIQIVHPKKRNQRRQRWKPLFYLPVNNPKVSQHLKCHEIGSRYRELSPFAMVKMWDNSLISHPLILRNETRANRWRKRRASKTKIGNHETEQRARVSGNARPPQNWGDPKGVY